MKKLALLSIFLALPLTGCPSATLQKAAQASENAAIIVQGLQTAEIAAHNQGLIPDADHQFIEEQILNLSSIGKTVDSCIGSAGTNAAAATCINTGLTEVQAIQANGGLYLKSAQAKSMFSIAMSGVESVLVAVETVLGQPTPAPAAAQ